MIDSTSSDAAGPVPAASPCDQRGMCPPCPWRLSNADREHPDDWYAPDNLARLWDGVRDGEPMSCHPTDPNNPVSDDAQEIGYRPAPAGARPLECIGSVIAVHRELTILQDDYAGDWHAYRRARPRGLTKVGTAEIAWRLIAGATPLARAMPKPDLNEPDAGLEAFGLDWPDRYRKETEQ